MPLIKTAKQVHEDSLKINNDFVSKVNLKFQECIENMQCVPLGPEYKNFTFAQAEHNLQLHRAKKKFEVPNDSLSSERKETTLEKVIEYDTLGITDFNPAILDLDPYVRRQLYHIRKRLNEVLSHYRFSVSKLEFPSGETYVSAGGDISLYAKLRDREQLTCTRSAFETFARIAYNTPMLKYAMRRHINMWQFETKKRFNHKEMWKQANEICPKKAKFLVFKAQLECVVTFVSDARLTTVPKDNSSDRVIECEALCNMICQRAIGCCIRDLIKEQFGVDLETSQTLHKLLIKDPDNATIDLSNASNSVWYSVVEWFMGGTTLFKYLKDTRCGTVSIGSERIRLNMLSPMGNGFTFEVMTLLLLTITREYDSMSHVYGDDIIVDTDVAQDVIELLSIIGFKTNDTKTFVNGNFKESCGGFTCEGKYITSFDFHYCLDVVDAVVLINKVGILGVNSTDLKDFWNSLHRELLEITPAALLRGLPIKSDYAEYKLNEEVTNIQIERRRKYAYHYKQGFWISYSGDLPVLNSLPGLTDGVFCDYKYSLRRKKLSSKCQAAYQAAKAVVEFEGIKDSIFTRLSWQREKTSTYIKVSKKSIKYKFKNGKEMRPIDNVNNLLAWTYIWAGKSQAPHLRDTVITTEWLTSP